MAKGVTNFLGVHTDERARNGDVGKNSSSSERGGGAGRKTSLGNERGTTSEICLSAAAAAAVRKSAGLARGVGWVGARADTGLLAASRRGHLTLYEVAVPRHGRSSPETYSLLMPAIRARSPSSASCPDPLMRRRRVDEAADSGTGPRRPRRGYGDDIPAHTQYQGGLPIDYRASTIGEIPGGTVPRRHVPNDILSLR
ncbi:hypothetical protein THAOC_27901 [Thalassiosira oceanica]|uniref:Uncharacterized protein n=1 Tax=Thalassiosira oceanica TaxID=159749 RepID=K0RVD9_THAOC|nr:hypothetical protein THAOC_27901 [Thalassiosira oceanica]|eukprot:EJK52791.1 hypothetical protein THAOC_27901 [Thalassiosira oceanica]